MASIIQDPAVLACFARHTPRLLRKQLLHQLVEIYSSVNSSSTVSDLNQTLTECKPSIQRFYGALLFVDISGFTALSLRLSVEELKNHINDYFTKMLDIVDKHGGDVIKFAGDALFIVWETVNNSSKDTGGRNSLITRSMKLINYLSSRR